MRIICDTHVPIFFQDQPGRMTDRARKTFEQGMSDKRLAIADISLWEIAMLFARGRLSLKSVKTADSYIRDLIDGYGLEVLPISPEIAIASQSDRFNHGDPADRLIAATAMIERAPLITADERLRSVVGLRTVW